MKLVWPTKLERLVLEVQRQVNVPIFYDDLSFEEALRLDLLVSGNVIVEVKAVELVNKVWEAQVLSQLKLTMYPLAFLINFNVPLIKDGIRRFANKDLLNA